MRLSQYFRATLALILSLALVSPAADALALARADDTVSPTNGYTQPLSFATTLTAIGEGGQASAGLPIPAGMVPVTLTGRITGTAVSEGVAVISVGTAQTDVSVVRGGTFSLELPPDTMVDSFVNVTLANRLNPLNDEKCSYDTTTTVTLSELAIVATGLETPPTTVAEFFSPSVRSISVVAPDASNPAVNQATLAAVGALSLRYGRDTTVTGTTAGKFVATSGPGVRVVLLEPSAQSSVTLTVSAADAATLTISGPPDLLSAAAAALGAPALGLAGATTATDLSLTGEATVDKVLTLAEVGTAVPILSGIGRVTYSTTVSQSRFGGPMRSFDVHLEGGNTANPPDGIETITVLWNDVIINSQTMTATDTYRVDEEIDTSLVKRDNTLTVRLEAIPPGGYCSATPLPAELTLNGTASTITGFPGQTLLPGFQRFPQTLGTRLPLAFGSRDVTPDMLASAAHLVSALQRASVPQLAITVVDVNDFFAAAYPGVIVGATPADAERLKAPLRFAPWRAVSRAGTEFTVTVDGPFAALEGFAPGGRDLLLLGGTEPPEKSTRLELTLAAFADADPFGWFVLTDDLLVTQPGVPTISLATATIVPQAEVTNEFVVPLWIAIALGAIILIAIARIISLSRRKRRIHHDAHE